jgi:hypothetical protein
LGKFDRAAQTRFTKVKAGKHDGQWKRQGACRLRLKCVDGMSMGHENERSRHPAKRARKAKQTESRAWGQPELFVSPVAARVRDQHKRQANNGEGPQRRKTGSHALTRCQREQDNRPLSRNARH